MASCVEAIVVKSRWIGGLSLIFAVSAAARLLAVALLSVVAAVVVRLGDESRGWASGASDNGGKEEARGVLVGPVAAPSSSVRESWWSEIERDIDSDGLLSLADGVLFVFTNSSLVSIWVCRPATPLPDE